MPHLRGRVCVGERGCAAPVGGNPRRSASASEPMLCGSCPPAQRCVDSSSSIACTRHFPLAAVDAAAALAVAVAADAAADAGGHVEEAASAVCVTGGEEGGSGGPAPTRSPRARIRSARRERARLPVKKRIGGMSRQEAGARLGSTWRHGRSQFRPLPHTTTHAVSRVKIDTTQSLTQYKKHTSRRYRSADAAEGLRRSGVLVWDQQRVAPRPRAQGRRQLAAGKA